MAFELPKLPYAYDALEPYIDAATMEIHHTKHHQAYIDKLNAALEGKADLEKKTIEEILREINMVPTEIHQAVVNHGGGHANHSFFWETLISPSQARQPKGKLLEALNTTFGSLAKFQEEFEAKAMGVFGSGWAWLLLTPDKKLILKRHSFQNSPLMDGNTPLLGIDVWEHAYYLKYQNKRADYIKAWWKVVNWEKVEELFDVSANR